MDSVTIIIVQSVIVVISALAGAHIYRRGTNNQSVFELPPKPIAKTEVESWEN
jgi:hypothetical protein